MNDRIVQLQREIEYLRVIETLDEYESWLSKTSELEELINAELEKKMIGGN